MYLKFVQDIPHVIWIKIKNLRGSLRQKSILPEQNKGLGSGVLKTVISYEDVFKTLLWQSPISSVIWQRGESQNGCYKHFLPPDTRTCVCISGVRNVRFSKNLACFCFLVTPILCFALLPYCRRYTPVTSNISIMP